MSVIVDLKDRQNAVRRIAEELHAQYKVVGGVLVVFVEEVEAPFGLSMPVNVVKVLPGRLRQIADMLERGNVEFGPSPVKTT